MCLAGKAILYMVRVDSPLDNPDIHEFTLNSIRRCGHTASTFFLELGRSSVLGPGELWIQTEDSLMAQHMHECILAAMSNSSNAHHNTTGSLSSTNHYLHAPLSSNKEQQHCSTNEQTTLVGLGQRSSSTGSQHRPRSSSASNELSESGHHNHMITNQSNNNNKANQQQSTTTNIVQSNSIRSAMHQQSITQSPQTTPISIKEHLNNEQQHVSSGGNHFVHFSPHSYFGHQHHSSVIHNCNGQIRNGSSNIIHHHKNHQQQPIASSSSTSQSPSTSRERLCSGSWSRTASEGSNEDLLSPFCASCSIGATVPNCNCSACIGGGGSFTSSSNSTPGPTGIGTNNIFFCDCMNISTSSSGPPHLNWPLISCACYANSTR